MSVLKKNLKKQNLKKRESVDKIELEEIKRKITPLYKLSYPDQLNYKCKLVKTNLKLLVNKIWKHAINRGITPLKWCTTHVTDDKSEDFNFKCFDEAIVLRPIISIDVNKIKEKPYSYRNKCEFTIGFSTGNISDVESEVRVGFVSYINNFEPIVAGLSDTCVLSKNSSNLPPEIIHPSMLLIVNKMENIVKLSSKEKGLKVYSRRERKGIWRLLLIRLSETNKEIMITIQTTHLNSSLKQEVINILLNEFLENNQVNIKGVNFFDYRISSIYLHQSNSIVDTFEDGELEILWGNEVLKYNINNTNLSVGPLSFFQTNTKGCEILYENIKNIVFEETISFTKKKKLYILDVCCGVGAIGLTILESLKNSKEYFEEIELIGIDCSKESIELAKKNAISNDAKNAKYIFGKAEEILPALLLNIPTKDSEIIAIVDPPRNGLHNDVIKSFREVNGINSLIYISCNVESLVKNCQELCFTFDPIKDRINCFPTFEPKYAIPIDMFPFTKHIETILYLRRGDRSPNEIVSSKIFKNPLMNEIKDRA